MVSEDRYLLIVDDMNVIGELLDDALTAEGFTVQITTSGDQALNAIRASVPALIIIDQMMPGKDGLQTLREAQAMISGVPVIMISGYAAPRHDLIEARRQELITRFVSKPFDIYYLIQLVKELLPSTSDPGTQKSSFLAHADDDQ